MLDANQGWDLPTAVHAARLLEAHDIFWLEDPMPCYDERYTLQRLKAAISIPIAVGETEYTPFGLRHMIAEGLVDYLIIDSTWAGSLTTWRKAAVMAEMYQIPLAAHHDPQIHVHAQAASPTGFILESFADLARDPLWFDLFSQCPELVEGYMSLPDGPGLGLELRDDTLENTGSSSPERRSSRVKLNTKGSSRAPAQAGWGHGNGCAASTARQTPVRALGTHDNRHQRF
jgi:L-alanine-DL-glutamate epimerase-like enolase superfamily enzyme